MGEFRALWLAQVLSVAGDQLARVALTLLVFDRTRSSLLAAITFAASVVPTFVGGVTLSGLADRWPRREVMIVCDLASAALVAAMAVPGVPIAVLVGMLFLVTMVSAPFTSARAALYPDILAGDRYVVGTAITLTTLQFAQVLGFAVGGAVVGLFGVRASLLADAVTFTASAVIIRIWVRARPAARAESRSADDERVGRLTAIRLVLTDPALRTPMLFGWLAAFYNVPEGVSAPLAASLGGGAVAVGLILAAQALGATIGAIAFSRLVTPARRVRWMGPLAVTACAILIAFVLHPPLLVTLAILGLSGVFDCYQLAANASFVRAAPTRHRSGVFGVAQAGMSLGQGTALIAAGAAAQVHSPSDVVAVGGAIGAICGVVIIISRRRTDDRPAAIR
ncbi:MAG TPA: MFS transporter [Streptosporangiaceae bacterium]|nr:MFS transporter [Streptosporangiaceae bacterium]